MRTEGCFFCPRRDHGRDEKKNLTVCNTSVCGSVGCRSITRLLALCQSAAVCSEVVMSRDVLTLHSVSRVMKGAFPQSVYKGLLHFGEGPNLMTSDDSLPGCPTCPLWEGVQILLCLVKEFSEAIEVVSQERNC